MITKEMKYLIKYAITVIVIVALAVGVIDQAVCTAAILSAKKADNAIYTIHTSRAYWQYPANDKERWMEAHPAKGIFIEDYYWSDTTWCSVVTRKEDCWVLYDIDVRVGDTWIDMPTVYAWSDIMGLY